MRSPSPNPHTLNATFHQEERAPHAKLELAFGELGPDLAGMVGKLFINLICILCHVSRATYLYHVFLSPSPASHSTSVQLEQVSHKTIHCRTIVSRRIWKPVGSQELYDLLTTVCDSLTPTVLGFLAPQVSFPETFYPCRPQST